MVHSNVVYTFFSLVFVCIKRSLCHVKVLIYSFDIVWEKMQSDGASSGEYGGWGKAGTYIHELPSYTSAIATSGVALRHCHGEE